MPNRWPTKLRRALVEYFSENDIEELCFDLQLDYQNLPGDGKGRKIIELIKHVYRHGKIGEFIDMCSQQRPNIPWKEIRTEALRDSTLTEVDVETELAEPTIPAPGKPTNQSKSKAIIVPSDITRKQRINYLNGQYRANGAFTLSTRHEYSYVKRPNGLLATLAGYIVSFWIDGKLIVRRQVRVGATFEQPLQIEDIDCMFVFDWSLLVWMRADLYVGGHKISIEW